METTTPKSQSARKRKKGERKVYYDPAKKEGEEKKELVVRGRDVYPGTLQMVRCQGARKKNSAKHETFGGGLSGI